MEYITGRARQGKEAPQEQDVKDKCLRWARELDIGHLLPDIEIKRAFVQKGFCAHCTEKAGSKTCAKCSEVMYVRELVLNPNPCEHPIYET